MPTIKEVSNLAGVSISTVSRVLNESGPVSSTTRKRVMKAVRSLDYQPNGFARGLVTNRSGGVGVTFTDLSPFFGTLLRGIESVIEGAGMHLMISNGHGQAETERRAVQFLKQHRADAVIAYLRRVQDEDLIAWAKEGVPLVILARYVPELAASCVYLDNELGGYLATKHLIEHGHRRVAHISGPMSMHECRDRLMGYRKALAEAGIPYHSDFVIEADLTEEGGEVAMHRLLERGLELTALFSANDQMAAGAMKTLRDVGLRVPEDLSIVGYDDVAMVSYLYVPLTTIRQPMLAMGRAAAELALAALRGEETGVRHKFEPELIMRQSVKPVSR